MANDVINKASHGINAATQALSNEVARTARTLDGSLPEAVQKLSDMFDKPAEGADAAQNKSLTAVSVGYNLGSGAAYAFEQGAKYLFGRGQRHQVFAGNSRDEHGNIKNKSFDGDYQKRAAYQHIGERPIDPRGDVEAQKAAEATRKSDARRNNYHAIKQDGILGLAVKGTAAMANAVGAMFCGDDETAAALSKNIDDGAHAFNAGARFLLVSVPMAVAVTTGVAVGFGVGAAMAGVRTLRSKMRRDPEKALDRQAKAAAKKTAADAAKHKAAEAAKHKAAEAATAPPTATPVSDAMAAKVGIAEDHILDFFEAVMPDQEAWDIPTPEDIKAWPPMPQETLESWDRKLFDVHEAVESLEPKFYEAYAAIMEYLSTHLPD